MVADGGNRSSASPVSGRSKRLELQVSTALKLCITEVDKFPSAAKMGSLGGGGRNESPSLQLQVES